MQDLNNLSEKELLQLISNANKRIDQIKFENVIKTKEVVLKLAEDKLFSGCVVDAVRSVLDVPAFISNEAVVQILEDKLNLPKKPEVTFESLAKKVSSTSKLHGFRLKSQKTSSSDSTSPDFFIQVVHGKLKVLCRNKGGCLSDVWNKFTLQSRVSGETFSTKTGDQKRLTSMGINCLEVNGTYIFPTGVYGIKISTDSEDVRDPDRFEEVIYYFKLEQYLSAMIQALKIYGFKDEVDEILSSAYLEYKYSPTEDSPMRFFSGINKPTYGRSNRHCMFECKETGEWVFYNSKAGEKPTLRMTEMLVDEILNVIADMRGEDAIKLKDKYYTSIICHSGFNETYQGSYEVGKNNIIMLA